MSYKIAVASSDGEQVDETFGAAAKFIIYEVADGKYSILEERAYIQEEPAIDTKASAGKRAVSGGIETAESCGGQAGCGDHAGRRDGGGNSGGRGDGCGCGNGAGSGCGGAGEGSAKAELVADCRCVVCRKIGFQMQKQLERRAISVFDVSCPVKEALEKIAYYFSRMDNHESLRA